MSPSEKKSKTSRNGRPRPGGGEGGIPLHRSIYEALLGEIRGGAYKVGERLPSEALLCERFGASRITVAKAFQGLQQDGLVTRRPGSGTYVEAPQEKGALKFGLLIPDLGTTDIFEPICQGIMRSPAARSHSLTWGHSNPGAGEGVKATEQLCQQYIAQGVDGVFFAPSEYAKSRDESNHKIASLLKRAGIQVVLLDRDYERYPERSNLDLVGIDNHRAGYLLARRLLQTGAKRLVFAALPNSAATVDMRIAGYREALNGAGSEWAGAVISGDFEDERFVRQMLNKHRFDGVVCANDVTAARLMQTLVALGVQVPQEVKMVGLDDVSYARFLPTPLTTLRQDCAEIGAVAMDTMLERLQHPEMAARDVLVRCELVVRSSCGGR